MLKLIFVIFSLLLLIYMIAPGPSSIHNFSDLSNSAKSDLPGDTVQVPNVAGYFSDNYRSYVVPFYQQDYKSKTLFPFAPLRLNYPPELAYTYIKDQTQSTYLEELVYPLRDSLFVNGFEPFNQDGSPKFAGAIKFNYGSGLYLTKSTIRFWTSNLITRLIVWWGIVVSILLLWIVGKKIIKND